jgi:hypothetical protein
MFQVSQDIDVLWDIISKSLQQLNKNSVSAGVEHKQNYVLPFQKQKF